MRKAYKITSMAALMLTSIMSLAGCQKKNSTSIPVSSSIGNDTSSGGVDVDPFKEADLIINYYRFDESYTDWGIWSWGGDNNGTGLMFNSKHQRKFAETNNWTWSSLPIKFGESINAYNDWGFTSEAAITLSEEFLDGIIIRTKSGTKDVDSDRNFDYTKKDANGVLNAYFITGNANIYYDIKDVPTVPVKDVYFSKRDTIKVENFYENDKLNAETVKIVDDKGNDIKVRLLINSGTNTLITLENPLEDVTTKYTLKYDEYEFAVSFKKYYNTSDFNKLYQYDGNDLGPNVVDNATTFKLWSPSATDVKINFYASATSEGIEETIALSKGEKGVWSYSIPQNLHGKYYNYQVTVFGKTETVSDPYASSSNANGVRSLVVDWSKMTTPVAPAPKVTSPSGVSVYETHVRDFTMNSSWNGEESKRGKYLGMIEEGTKLATGEATGFDYVKSLGVSHIQLLPIYDFNSVDETKLDDEAYKTARRNGIYNWGYDPYSYASLEGSYSSDPNDGFTRINEFKALVDAYNRVGIGVIMDVVYNHMPSEQLSTYNKIMPDYYFRTNSYSGAGSDLASENAMVKNMMVQTTTSLAKNYNLAGFRFDLMGLLTKSSMQAVDASLRSFDEDILLYGEGWSMYGGDKYLPSETQAIQGSMKNADEALETEIGYFNDTYRDAMKGNVFNDTDKGFMQIAYNGTDSEKAGLEKLKEGVYDGISGSTYKNKWSQYYTGVSINYTEAHDNLTLHDKLYMTNPDLSEAERNAIQSQANAITALSTGISFFHSGTEFARSKEMPVSWLTGDNAVTEKYSCTGEGDNKVCFVNDSYNFSDEINAIDWTLVNKNSEMVDSFKKVLTLRNSSDLAVMKPTSFKDYSFQTLDSSVIGIAEDEVGEVISYKLSSLSEVSAKDVAVVFNCSSTEKTIADLLKTDASAIYYNGVTTDTIPTKLAGNSYLVIVY